MEELLGQNQKTYSKVGDFRHVWGRHHGHSHSSARSLRLPDKSEKVIEKVMISSGIILPFIYWGL
jgi:hypothetical protein